MNDVFTELSLIYDRVTTHINKQNLICNMRGVCCDFYKTDHRLYATKLEIDYMLFCSSKPIGVAPKKCPWFLDGRCNARQGRVLGCRAYFCTNEGASSEIYELFYQEIKALHKKWHIEYLYVPVFKYLSEREQHDESYY